MKTFNELKASAKIQISGKIGVLFAMYVIMLGIAVAVGLVPAVGGIASFVLSSAFYLGGAWVFLKITKGETVTVGNIFMVSKICGRLLRLSFSLIFLFRFGHYF